MKKAMMTAIAALSAVAVYAQDFGAEAEVVETESAEVEATESSVEATLPPALGEGNSIKKTQEMLEEEAPIQKSAKQTINDYFNEKRKSKGWKRGYDPENERIIVIADISFDIEAPEVSTDFINQRNTSMAKLMLQAKSEIISQIVSEMSGERIYEIPGNPIAKQIEAERKKVEGHLEIAKRNLAELDADFAEALAQRDRVTSSELLATISSWFTSADKKNIAAQYDADKKERYENTKKHLREAQAAYKELAEKAEAARGKLAERFTNETLRESEMQIHGCTVLQQAESIEEKNGSYKYEIAILVSWSVEMQTAATEILSGRSVKFNPGKKSIEDWIEGKAESGALALWCGPRQYIDEDGNMWFLGIVAAPVTGNSMVDRHALMAAKEKARAEVVYALYADAKSTATVKELSEARMGADGKVTETFYPAIESKMRESFKGLVVKGISEQYNDTLTHEPSGLEIQVVVYGVNSGTAENLKAIAAQAKNIGIEIDTTQEMERGYQQQMKAAAKAAKNNPAARAAGAEQARQNLATEAAKAKARRDARKKNSGFKPAKSSSAGSTTQKGRLRSGTIIIDDDEE